MKLAANAFIVSLTTAAVLAGSNLARASDAGAVVAQAAGADLAGLQVLSPTGRAGDRLRWAAWQAPAVDGAVGRGVRFALFRRTAGAARREWTIVRPEAYMPAIQIVSSWSYLGRPIALPPIRWGRLTRS